MLAARRSARAFALPAAAAPGPGRALVLLRREPAPSACSDSPLQSAFSLRTRAKIAADFRMWLFVFERCQYSGMIHGELTQRRISRHAHTCLGHHALLWSLPRFSGPDFFLSSLCSVGAQEGRCLQTSWTRRINPGSTQAQSGIVGETEPQLTGCDTGMTVNLPQWARRGGERVGGTAHRLPPM